jgi:hypothetical protein
MAWLIASKTQEAYSTGTGVIISSGKLEYDHPLVSLGSWLIRHSQYQGHERWLSEHRP